MPATPDDRLVALVAAGSAPAFDEIASRYRRRLHAYCARLVGPANSEDVVQQTLLRAYLALRRGDLRELALRPWLYRIARNCSIDMLRSRPPDHEQLDLEFDGVPQPPRLVEQKEEIGSLVAAMRALPEGQRRALTLRELEGRSYSEISAEMGQSGPRVRQLIFRARESLRAGLGALVPGGLFRRLLGNQPPMLEAHHTALAAKLSSGGALEVVGAMAAATITVLAGSAALSSPVSSRNERPAAHLAGPLHYAGGGSGGAGVPDSADHERRRQIGVTSGGLALTGGARLSLLRRSFDVATPAAEGASAAHGPVRAQGEAASSTPVQASSEPAAAPAAPSSDPAAEQGATGATGPAGPPQEPGPPTGGDGSPAGSGGPGESGGATIELLVGVGSN